MNHLRIAWALMRMYFRMTPRDWYRRPPFLPIPPRRYLEWRLGTAYGKRRPPLRIILHDVWQLGDWLRSFPGAE